MKKKDNGLPRTKEQVHKQLGLLIERKRELVQKSLDDEEDRHGYINTEHCEINGAIAALNWLIDAEDTEPPAEALIGFD